MNQATGGAGQLLRGYIELPATVHVLCLGSFINRVGSFVMLFLTIYVSEELGMGARFASYCIGMFGVGSVISALLGGQMADQFGRRFTMLLALFGGGTMLMGLSLIRNGWVFMALLFLFAVVMEMYRPAASAMIGDVTDSTRRPHAYGLLFLSFNLGFAVAPPLGGYLAARSFYYLFWVDGLTTCLYGLVVLLFLRETRPKLTQSSADTSADVAAEEARHSGDSPVAAAEALATIETSTLQSSPTERSAGSVSLLAALRHVAGDHHFLMFCFCSLLTNIVFMQAFVTLPLYLRGMGFNELQFGSMICVNGLMIVLFQLPFTPLLNRFPRRYVLLTGELLMALGFGLTVFADTAVLIVLTIILWTFGEIFQAPYKPSLVAEMAPPALRARYMGIFNISHALSIALGAPLGGLILSRFGPTVHWPGCGLLLVITTGMYLSLFRRLELRAGAEKGVRYE